LHLEVRARQKCLLGLALVLETRVFRDDSGLLGRGTVEGVLPNPGDSRLHISPRLHVLFYHFLNL
jgi:hypothetical protein